MTIAAKIKPKHTVAWVRHKKQICTSISSVNVSDTGIHVNIVTWQISAIFVNIALPVICLPQGPKHLYKTTWLGFVRKKNWQQLYFASSYY